MVIAGDLKINFVFIRKYLILSHACLVEVSSIMYPSSRASCNDCILFWVTTIVAQMGGNTIEWQMCHSRVRQKMGASQQSFSLDKHKKRLLLILYDWVWVKNANPEENHMWAITKLWFMHFQNPLNLW